MLNAAHEPTEIEDLEEYEEEIEEIIEEEIEEELEEDDAGYEDDDGGMIEHQDFHMSSGGGGN